ncbi:MAG TPA: MBL fold metallo-hydrolase [Bryobacteraceae bacterium]|nr:MBL fold metallo-hydrolase [Bryobacteraceae bacterium]
MYRILICLLALASLTPAQTVKTLKIRILSTMLTSDEGIGEWGFSALVEADGHRILFDTGARPDTVLNNARELKVDLAGVPDVILSHNHSDHTGGLKTLRQNFPQSFTVAHVGKGITYPRKSRTFSLADYTGRVVEYDHPVQIYPGVWLTGPVPRKYPERNWSGTGQVQTPEGWVEDNIPEDMSLVFNTADGLVLLSGCGHAGVINTVEYAREKIRNAPLYAAIGGFHLYALDDAKLDWTARKLREFGLENFLGAHCTGIEATERIRQLTGLNRKTASVAAVGAVFELGKPMDPGSIAR